MTSSSIVSMRFLLSGPVLSIFCVPSGFAQVWITPRVLKLLDQGRIFEVIRVFEFFLGVEVVQRAHELVKAVRRRQGARRRSPR